MSGIRNVHEYGLSEESSDDIYKPLHHIESLDSSHLQTKSNEQLSKNSFSTPTLKSSESLEEMKLVEEPKNNHITIYHYD